MLAKTYQPTAISNWSTELWLCQIQSGWFLTAISHHGLRNCFLFLCFIYFIQFLFRLLFPFFYLDFYFSFIYGLLFPFSILTFISILFQFSLIFFQFFFDFFSILFLFDRGHILDFFQFFFGILVFLKI